MIVSGWILLVMLLVVVLGYAIVYAVVNHKWGYTPKREKELENIQNNTAEKSNIR